MKQKDQLLANVITKLDLEEIEKLLKEGANPNALDKNGNPLLYPAITSNNLGIVKALLDYGANPNVLDKDGKPILSQSIATERIDILNALLINGADPNLRGADIPVLLRAANIRELDAVKALLDYGADPNALDKDGNPILLRAVSNRNLDIVKALLKYGANPNALDKDKNPIFAQAISNSSLDIVKLLLDYRVNPNILDKDGDPIISLAVESGIASRVESLLRYGANPNILDKDGNPLIFKTMMRESPNMLEAFLTNEKTDLAIKDKEGNSALGVMLEIGRKVDMASLFIERATNKEEAIKEVVNLKNSKGETILHIAAKQGNIEIFNKYLDYYVKSNQTVNIVDDSGYTPLYWAKLFGHTEISDLLTKRTIENGNTAYTKITKTESFEDLPPRPKIAVSYNLEVGGVTAGNVKDKLITQYSDVEYIDYRKIVPISANTEGTIDEKIISEAKKKITEYLADKDALVIPGNNLAVDPKVAEKFGGKVTVTEKSDFARSLAETLMVEVAMEKGMPIMGVCGGHQIVNAYLKGKITNLHNHDHKHDSIIIEPNTELAEIIKKTNPNTKEAPNQKVWASHTNIVQELGGKDRIAGKQDLLKVVAKTGQEEIEATESQFGSPIRTFQFHPEMSYANFTYTVSIKEILRDKKIFASFVQSAETFASKRKLNTEIKSPRIQQLLKNIIEAKANPKQLPKNSSSRSRG